ncbi:glycosyltransferase [Rubritalea marina]|uniref:glycosyltransferase n=1 Tax=Rubritalea marina TaxID=361055 RepID=UPI00036CB55F|nr:glycosyltransferase [Rubritalea marina]
MLLIFPLLGLAGTLALREVFSNPRFLPDADSTQGSSNISVIIPARDEEANIGNLIQSLQHQHLKPLEIIIVDDGSSDATASIAQSHGATVITGSELPAGWKGKPWACMQGVEASTGELLLFLDADVRLSGSEALAKLKQAAQDHEGAVSVNPKHLISEPYEEASSFFNTLMVLGVNAFGRGESDGRQAALFGQCMLIPKSLYQEIGGHECVKNCTLENFHLSQHLHAAGHACSSYLGGQDISMRMFPGGFTELWNSWKKGFSNGAANTNKRALTYSSLWISGAMFSLISLLLSPLIADPVFTIATLAAYIIYAGQCWNTFSKIGNFSAWNAALFPLALLFYQTLFFVSLMTKKLGKTTDWKGRQVH